MNINRGLLIVLEGIDQSGKSSATQRVCELLEKKGIQSVKQPFPDRSTDIGKLIDEFLHGKNLPQQVVHLLYSANRWEVAQNIKETLEKGITVICDRYAFSGIVYSIANGLDEKWCNSADCGLPKPDIVFFLELSLEDAEKRRKTMKTDRYENTKFQSKVKCEYEKFKDSMKWTCIDASQSKEEVALEITSIIEQQLPQLSNQPIKTLNLI
ncbi:thymidylate kinase [Entamoeba histolytica HM-3:IMSS]|uniref:Thymidylate kinase n=4 Tax=Entamoeba histolytica TaxID=5759 RepID=C4LYE0_ENTH1|nr:Thymidylate kinase, putative [Entamoeba histolytica HM-1:IMSS]EAL48995.1 Thymidylate kinase, putative [Entamoeba histolytica HM-1:IMSS]EMD49762.1 thymidylate kinase, putative [Entamoeba histolytica KU27]EMS11965.1 thymidylate kinase [Entamoeba histolytica HM-3:IMSS]GAT93833.1 thymidylate kinase putative [Entamoeba histolytica]|eukprot:XP_654383.1 Thymidylate kinase, putative [Entamoeba histolytica HM-1:IMSS]